MFRVKNKWRLLLFITLFSIFWVTTGLAENNAGQVTLTSPGSEDIFKPGDQVAIGGTAQNISQITISIRNANGGLIYTAQPTIVNGAFTTDFTLADDAVEGEYQIKMGGAGLAASPYEFKVSRESDNSSENPSENPSNPPSNYRPSPSPHSSSKPSNTNDKIQPTIHAGRNFKDITNHWAKKEIETLVEKGIVNGMTETEFAPNANITRAQFATLLIKALEMDVPKGASVAFKDVPANVWYKDIVAAAVKSGLINGYDVNTFGPDDNITREQMAVMMARALKVKPSGTQENENLSELNKFNDLNHISNWAQEGVAIAAKNGIVNGMDEHTFAPSTNATRAQGAVMILRLYNLL